MNLLDENYGKQKNNNKIFMACGIGIIIVFLIIMVLLAFANTLKGNQISLTIDGQTVDSGKYLIQKDDNLYINIEELTKAISANNFSYKSGSKDVEDDSKCYITNSYESIFFEVNSDVIFKYSEDTKETQYYKLENQIIKENGKIYMPLSAVQLATNSSCNNVKGAISIVSIGKIESTYNQEESKTFFPDASIVWETTYANKKLLKHGLVIVQDADGKMGLAKLSYSTTTEAKIKVTRVSTQSIIDSKYTDIKYVEKFNQLIVETEAGKGIIQLEESEDGNFKVKTKIVPQYEDIKQITENLYIVSKTSITSNNNKNTETKRYGLINNDGNTILPIEYEQIGIDASNYTNNELTDAFIIEGKYIPVKKNGLWGLINLSGKEVLKISYDSLGCADTNASSNVLIIPELDSIVVKKDNSYGIVTYTGEVVMKNVLTRVYIETISNKRVYTMVYNNNKYNVVEYVNNAKKSTNNTSNTTNKTNTTNTTNNANKTNTTNKANTTNTTKN